MCKGIPAVTTVPQATYTFNLILTHMNASKNITKSFSQRHDGKTVNRQWSLDHLTLYGVGLRLNSLTLSIVTPTLNTINSEWSLSYSLGVKINSEMLSNEISTLHIFAL